ncbi:MAG: PKD domain-containing protein [Patescibacteria group bacterium]
MRYFDKTFFKFTLGFLVIVAVSLLIMYAASAYAVGVDKIVFTTEPQTIKPNELSGAITIQTQDLGGNSFQTPETLDIQYISTSATGEFLGSTGNPATTYMSKNTANKTFYYKDVTEGVFTITINVRGRDTGVELNTSQQVTVSSGTPQSSQNPQGEVLGTSSETSLSGSSSSSGGGNTTRVSSLNSQLDIQAGNDRATTPGSPIWFQATIKKNTTGLSPDLSWSFGDGHVGTGPLVSHEYKYPGDYAVVLSSRAGDMFSVSRLKVKVAKSNISVVDKGEYLEIVNNGSSEINLFNWKIENQGKGFVFQPNTIILPHSSIKLDKSLLTMKGFDNSMGTSLKNCLKEEVFAIAPIEKKDWSEVAKNVDNIKQQALAIQAKLPTPKIEVKNTEVVINNLLEATTSIDNVIYEVPKEEGFFKRAWGFIAGLFD